MLAEVDVIRGDRGPAALPPGDVSTRFEAVITERGPAGVAVPAVSKAQMHGRFGDNQPYSTLRPCDAYFDEGGGRVVLTRVVGTAARAASFAVRDRDGRTIVTLSAAEAVGGRLYAAPGSWYHAIRTTIVAGTGDERVVTIRLGDAVLATGTCADADDLIDLARTTGYLDGAAGIGVWPAVVAADQPLTGGDDDRANIADADVTRALAVLTKGLGAGSVCASGWTTFNVHRALAEHADANTGYNRFARCDLPDVDSAATLIAHARQVRALTSARYVQLLAGWPTITVAGVALSIPASGHLTGREARTDRENQAGPGQPAAWTFGEFATATGVSRSWSKSDREQMLDAGITIIVQDETGAVFAEDAVTAVDPTLWPAYAEVSAMRVTMAIQAEIEAAMRPFVRRALDGRGHVANQCEVAAIGICTSWYQRDALYGETAADAFATTVTPVVEPGRRPRLVGHAALRPSPSVQKVEFTITQVAAGDTI